MTDKEFKIKVVADTSDLDRKAAQQERQAEQSLKRAQSQLAEARRENAQLDRSAARWQVAAASATTGAMGARIFARNRGLIGDATARTFRSQMFRSFAVGMVGRFVPVVGAALVAGGVFSMMRGRRQPGRTSGESDSATSRQEQLLTQLVANSTRSSQSLQALAITARQQADPLGRSMAFHQERSRRLGLGLRSRDINAALGLSLARQDQQDTAQALASRRGIVGELAADIQRGIINANTFVGSTQLRVTDARDRFLGVGSQAYATDPRTRRRVLTQSPVGVGDDGSLLQRMLGGLTSPITSVLGFNTDRAQRTALQRQIEQQQESIRFTQTFRGLSRIGPGNMLQAPPTIRAGDESEYRFRVEQQRRGMQTEANREWQQQMLSLMSKMVDNGTATRQDQEKLVEAFNPDRLIDDSVVRVRGVR